MSWIFLILASLCEIAFAGSLKQTNNFSNAKWTIVFIFFYILSIVLLNKAIQKIPIGTAYAVWTGIGAAGTVVLGILYFKEPCISGEFSFYAPYLSIVGLNLYQIIS